MAINNWRKVDETSFNQQMRLMGKMADAGTTLIDSMYNATNNTSNTNSFSIGMDKDWDIWMPFTFKTKKGRLLTGKFVWTKWQPWEHFEVTDVKFWWEPMIITVSPKSKINNWTSLRVLANTYKNWWKWELPDIEYLDWTLDDELDKRYNNLKEEYIKTFKEYSKARPDQRWDMTPKIAEALIKYNLLNK